MRITSTLASMYVIRHKNNKRKSLVATSLTKVWISENNHFICLRLNVAQTKCVVLACEYT
jgi:hypothetical protein